MKNVVIDQDEDDKFFKEMVGHMPTQAWIKSNPTYDKRNHPKLLISKN